MTTTKNRRMDSWEKLENVRHMAGFILKVIPVGHHRKLVLNNPNLKVF